MASRVPIVASDLPSMRTILNENNSILVPSDDGIALVEAINKLLKDERLSEKITGEAYADVQSLTWEKRSKNILKFIKDLELSN